VPLRGQERQEKHRTNDREKDSKYETNSNPTTSRNQSRLALSLRRPRGKMSSARSNAVTVTRPMETEKNAERDKVDEHARADWNRSTIDNRPPTVNSDPHQANSGARAFTVLIAVPMLTAIADIKLNRQLNLPDWACHPYQLSNRAISPCLRSPSAARGRRCPRGDPANDVSRISSIAAAKCGTCPVAWKSRAIVSLLRLAVANELWPEQIMGGPLDEAADDPDDRREFVRGWIYRSALLSIPGQITALPCSVWSGGR
jgi:hypothetical protein